MSALTGAAGPVPRRVVTAAPVRAVVPALARQEARRLLLHPVSLIGWAIYVVNAVITLFEDQGPRSAVETVSLLPAFYPGMLLVLAGTLLAGRDRRAGSAEVLGPLPGRAEERVKAWLLAAVAQGLVALVAVTVLHVAYLTLDRYTHEPGGVPGVALLLTGPVTLVGAVAFGVMVGVWAPSRVAGVLGLVALVVLNLAVDGDEQLQLLGMAVGWARWGLYADSWGGVWPGSPGLHALYLASLTTMAAAAAWLRVADRRRPPIVLGLAALGCAVLFGIGQLP